jgi:hypothetical protein
MALNRQYILLQGIPDNQKSRFWGFLLPPGYPPVIYCFFLAALCCFPAQTLLAQYERVPVNQEERWWYENDLLTKKHQLHTAIWPYKRSEVDTFDRRKALLPATPDTTKGLVAFIKKKLLSEPLIPFNEADGRLNIFPVLALSAGTSDGNTENRIFQFTRGLHLEGALGKKVSFYTTIAETQARFPLHVAQQTRISTVAPGYWRVKSLSRERFDFAYAAGELAYSPNQTFHFRLGHGKQFIGEGYRSMLISDNAVNAPFFRIETSLGKRFRYVNYWAVMNDIRREVETDGVFGRKYLNMHYLSFHLSPSINLGFFEGLMWGDEQGRYRLNVNFLNPVILFRPVEFAQGYEGGNIFWGFQGSWQSPWGVKLYGQMGMDEFNSKEVFNWQAGSWSNMFSWQAGIKAGDAFGIENLFLRAEYNIARPFIYSHLKVLTNWGHYAQPLAHPWGANFRELLFMAHYRYKRWQGRLALHAGVIGRDPAGQNLGGDIYKSYETRTSSTGNFTAQGAQSNIRFMEADLSYCLNPLYNLRIKTGYRSRSETGQSPAWPGDNNFYFGVFTNLYTSYQDF